MRTESFTADKIRVGNKTRVLIGGAHFMAQYGDGSKIKVRVTKVRVLRATAGKSMASS